MLPEAALGLQISKGKHGSGAPASSLAVFGPPLEMLPSPELLVCGVATRIMGLLISALLICPRHCLTPLRFRPHLLDVTCDILSVRMSALGIQTEV